MRISCPPTISPCFYGVDTPQRSELIARDALARGDPPLHRRGFARLSESGRAAVGRGHGAEVVLHVVLHGRVSGGVPRESGGVPAAGAQARRVMSEDRLSAVGRRHRRGQRSRPPHQGARTRAPTRPVSCLASDRSAGCSRSTRRCRSRARRERRRRRHQAEGRVPRRRARHDRRRSRQPLRQRHPRAGRAAAVLPGLPGDRAGCRPTSRSRSSAAWPQACRENGCALLGGETAEMPGFYADGEYDVAGFIVGVVSRARIVDGRTIVAGDVLVALAVVRSAHQRLLAGAARSCSTC